VDIITVNIFDFDGTLFRSPTPHRDRWGRSHGTICGMRTDGGLGWFQDVITLSPPYVPAAPDSSWFIANVVDKVIQSMNTPTCLTVLLTGRAAEYFNIIETIVTNHKLQFDYYALKNSQEKRTMQFKKDFITDLLALLPNVKYLNIWEDRPKHALEFEEWLKLAFTNIVSVIHRIEELDTNLPEEIEIDLIRKLIERNCPDAKLKLERIVEHSVVELDPNSKLQLLSLYPPPPNWTMRSGQMTICPGGLATFCNLQNGTEVTLTVLSLGQNEKVQAIRVSGVPSVNANPYLTLSLAPDAISKDITTLTTWNPVPPLILKGKVVERSAYTINHPQQQHQHTHTQQYKGPTIQVAALVKQLLPDIDRKKIGEAINIVKLYLKENPLPDGDNPDLSKLVDFIKNLKL